MKHLGIITITFFSFFFCRNVYSQSEIYFDKDWKTATKEEAYFYRTIHKKNDSLFYIKDYYINGVLQMDGHFSNLENETMEGKVNFYNKQGGITNSETYRKGVLHGLTKVYLKNGNIDYTTAYKNGKIYNGVYNGVVKKRFYKNGIITKDIEHSPPNQYYILKTIIYGREMDSVYWRTAKGRPLGLGIYKDNKIIEGLRVLNLLDNTVYTYYKNSLREGIQKVYNSNGKLIANMTYKSDQLILDETLNPLTNKMVACTYKNNQPLDGRYFEYKPMYNYYDEFVFENGIQKKHNRYAEDKDGNLKLYESK